MALTIPKDMNILGTIDTPADAEFIEITCVTCGRDLELPVFSGPPKSLRCKCGDSYWVSDPDWKA